MRDRLLLAICVSSVFGCSDQPKVLVDTSDARFAWSCAKGVCELELLPETPDPMPCPETSEAGYSYVWGRFVEIVSVCGFPEDGGWSSTLEAGRYLACSDDGDCPQLDFYEQPELYECSAGLCQNVDVDRYPRDLIHKDTAYRLCIAEMPRDFGISPELEALLTAHCGLDHADPCELPLPESCWQPI